MADELGDRRTSRVGEALQLQQLLLFDRPHEDVPLGRRELRHVARLADANLVLVDLDGWARISARAEAGSLGHHVHLLLNVAFPYHAGFERPWSTAAKDDRGTTSARRSTLAATCRSGCW